MNTTHHDPRSHDLATKLRQHKRRAFIEFARESPELTLAELIDLARDAGELSTKIREFAPKCVIVTRRGPRRVTPERQKYTMDVLTVFEQDRAWKSANEVRTRVGGNPEYLRTTLRQLISEGFIEGAGKAAGRRYKFLSEDPSA